MQKQPHVLHVNTSHAWGGLELYTINLLKKMHETGQKPAIYCIEGSKIACEAEKHGIKVFYAYKQARISIKDILNIKKIIKKNKFQIIHTHTRQDVWLVSLTLIFIKNVKQIFSLYMSAPSKKSFIHRLIYSKVSAITSSSEILNENIKENYPIKPEQIHLLRYGRELNSYVKDPHKAENLRKEWNTHKDDIVIATMCRIDPAKGVREIAEAILLLKPEIKNKIKLWIMGEPTLLKTSNDGKPIYEQKAYELNNWLKNFITLSEVENRIQLIPFQANIIPFLNAMDIFILGTYEETYSLSVIDAMSMGLPVIGTHSGGTPEQVKHNHRGILIKPKDPQEIANAITTYLENPKLICEHGENAKKWVYNEHSWENKLTKLNKLYEDIWSHK
ncbi:glycosyltransferase family 4 protein [Fluviispira multicolorata]|uniref:Glycosyltransferase n=1 Tax=Fluviispira multicolorata TaxID=2654512 RepID=A0A833JCQ5_9BACT|nr:glycosyltransferase family 4 protein [Fluviispira multicolorata]KAB8029935.1 glycosyltransferase [Fluviispira multicolorata]